MQDQYVKIGEAAGKIFRTLEEKGERTVTQLQKDTGISDRALFNQGLGWLAREDKINLSQAGRTVKLSLLTAAV